MCVIYICTYTSAQAACFINPPRLFGAGRKTVTKVAVAVGRPGITCFPERVPNN